MNHIKPKIKREKIWYALRDIRTGKIYLSYDMRPLLFTNRREAMKNRDPGEEIVKVRLTVID